MSAFESARFSATRFTAPLNVDVEHLLLGRSDLH